MTFKHECIGVLLQGAEEKFYAVRRHNETPEIVHPCLTNTKIHVFYSLPRFPIENHMFPVVEAFQGCCENLTVLSLITANGNVCVTHFPCGTFCLFSLLVDEIAFLYFVATIEYIIILSCDTDEIRRANLSVTDSKSEMWRE